MSSSQIDLYCLGCGYNLRGLEGDPIRCPECGRENPRNWFEVTEREITKRLAYMQDVLGQSAWLSAILVAGGVGIGLMKALRSGGAITDPMWLCIFGIGVALFNAVRFRGICRGRSGWLSGFLRYHTFIHGFVLGTLVAVSSVVWALVLLARHGNQTVAACTFVVSVLGGILLFFKLLAVVCFPVQARILRTIEPMEREAVRDLLLRERRMSG